MEKAIIEMALIFVYNNKWEFVPFEEYMNCGIDSFNRQM